MPLNQTGSQLVHDCNAALCPQPPLLLNMRLQLPTCNSAWPPLLLNMRLQLLTCNYAWPPWCDAILTRFQKRSSFFNCGRTTTCTTPCTITRAFSRKRRTLPLARRASKDPYTGLQRPYYYTALVCKYASMANTAPVDHTLAWVVRPMCLMG